MKKDNESVTVVTKHAEERIIERLGVSKSSVQRVADRAYLNGIKMDGTQNALNRWIIWMAHDRGIGDAMRTIRIYGEYVFIFSGNTLITVHEIPQRLKKQARGRAKKMK